MPAYVVASDRSLREMAHTRPSSLDQLLAVYGFGPAKVAKYGQGFLDVVWRSGSK